MKVVRVIRTEVVLTVPRIEVSHDCNSNTRIDFDERRRICVRAGCTRRRAVSLWIRWIWRAVVDLSCAVSYAHHSHNILVVLTFLTKGHSDELA